jgi:hypothetical protein
MRRKILAVVAALLLAPGPTWTQEPAKDEEVQPRFIWGILIQIAISKLASASWDVFSKWLENRVPTVTDRSAPPNLAVESGAEIKARSSGAVAERSPGSIVGNPTAPLSLDGGKENYQGIHVALVAQAPDGKDFAYRPISSGFKTGERFKLRVVSTFAGELTIENINPRGEHRHLYPPKSDHVVALQPGRETFLPLGKDEYFQFTRATGREQLVVNLADPRAVGQNASRHQVYRQDVKYGSNFLQQVAPNTFPRISQAVELTHSAH